MHEFNIDEESIGCTRKMDFRKCTSFSDAPSLGMAPLNFSNKVHEKGQFEKQARATSRDVGTDLDIDLREVYFLIMHFLSAGPCQRTFGQFWNELLEHQLLPRRYHAWYSRSGAHSGDDNDNGISFPLSYNNLLDRNPHIEKDHLIKLLKQLILSTAPSLHGKVGRYAPNAADVPTLLGTGSFSLLDCDRNKENKQVKPQPAYLRWPHMQADQVRGLSLREIGGGFTKHHRAPSIRSACYAIAKPSTMVQKMQNIKKLRGHRDAVYCAIFDRSGRYVITGSDDRLVKIWSMETAFCLASCRGHEGDITDLAVSSNNALVASASNDFIIRVWRLPDGLPISVLRGHTGAVTAIAFSPKPNSVYQLLSSSDDGTCRIWDARYSQCSPRIYLPKPSDAVAGKSSYPPSNGPSSSNGPQNHQILCCAYNANGTVFVTGSSDTFARVWNACKSNTDDSEQPVHEMDVLSGHENDVNYVQFSGCAVASRSSMSDTMKEENIPKFKNSWFCHDNIVTCSRDGSAIIWVPKPRRSHGKVGRWTRAYHLKVPPPPMPPQPPRGGPRQRFLPTPRGVNMIVWSLDNRFVLAAIMDCRICVWNAADGSLVHSLTGHNASTYVLDVHPFNPRIAMSAGYDGKTIVWDIWEGTPIRIYEIGRFKLVDGKFSPDGTSIVLSDDVGQIYLLSTGQGEYQKDAKYDQFFLGDYRPLIQDTLGNSVDQETQLVPYRRNIQDPLCDPSMIPYPEPYQSMYQRRRLGALGIEWRPSSIKFGVGTDISLGQDYQMLPLADLDRMIEPLPEFIDAMYWEPENEVISDDTDSEYNVAEEYSSEGEKGSLSAGSTSDPECSAEDSDVERNHKDGLRRSRRKKHNAEAELMTSSGRRVKRRILGQHDGTLSGSNKTKKSKNGRKASKRKSSKAMSLRPQRIAARNARTMFSQITGTSTDGEEEDGSEDDSSDSESMLQDLTVQSGEPDKQMQNVPQKYSGCEQPSLDEYEAIVKPPGLPEPQSNVGNRRRLILKFSIRDSKKSVPSENTRPKCDNQSDLAYSSSGPPQETKTENKTNFSSEYPGSSNEDAIDAKLSQNHDGRQPENVEDHLEMSAGDQGNEIKWGNGKVRTSKRLRSEDVMPTDASAGSNTSFDLHIGYWNDVIGHVKPENYNGKLSSSSEIQYHEGALSRKVCGDEEQFGTGALLDLDSGRNEELAPPDDTHKSSSFDLSPTGGLQLKGTASTVSCNENLNKGDRDWSGSGEYRDYDKSEINEVGTNCYRELKENPLPKVTKLRIKTKSNLRDPKSPSKLKFITAVEDSTRAGHDLVSETPSYMERNLILGVPEEGECTGRSRSLQKFHSDSNTKMYNGFGNGMEENTSNTNDNNNNSEINFPEPATDAVRRTRSMGMKASSREPNVVNSNFKVRETHESVGTSKNAENSMNPSKEWTSRTKVTVRSRSTRSRSGGHYDNDLSSSARRKSQSGDYFDNDPSPLARRNSHNPERKLSWLTLSEHDEGYRYIPQLGDEVIYLRQGHQEYIESSSSSEAGSWGSIKGNLNAVEICTVEGLDYATIPSGDSCCKITLRFVDPCSSMIGKAFKLTLPELVNFPDFVVEKTRYDAAMRRNWTPRDKCQVWWKNENGEGGSWWEGRIVSSQAKSDEFPDSPWERYSIRYKSDPTIIHQHSPWELHDLDSPWEHPDIDYETRNKLLSSFAKLEESAIKNQDYYGVQNLNRLAEKVEYWNRFPVPLYPELIQKRLANNYYRSLEAVKHDVMVMGLNVESLQNAKLLGKMRHLSEWFTKTISKL